MRTRMEIHPRIRGARGVIATLLAAVLVMGGCAATHVGEAWQCPLAQGSACTSMAEADPAVALPGKAPGLTTRGPLPPVKTAGEGDFHLLAWLAEFFGILGFGEELDEEDAATAEPLTAPPTEVLPDAAAHGPVLPDEAPPDAVVHGLRTKERIARIWIAPFVDAEGIYHEGGWVRAVMKPARWRLP